MTTDLVVRLAVPEDGALLAAFRCSDGPYPEQETEDHVRGRLAQWAFAPGAQVDEPRVLLLHERDRPGRLVAVAAHERLTELRLPTGPLDGTKAHLVAVSLPFRRTRIAGRRPGDLAMAALVHDALTAVSPRAPYTAAVVAADNKPSLALCNRHGMTLEVPRSPGYVWRVGRLG